MNATKHPHLLTLLATYTYNGRLNLIFPWADANLQKFWENAQPDPLIAPWMARQCLGLAQGLKTIHHSRPEESEPLERTRTTDLERKNYGRHGDLKPENILLFKGRGENSMNVLQIADFGLAGFHSTISRDSVPTHNVGMTPTYRGPEYDVLKKIGQPYDIWCFGCVLLEFVEWYLRGWEGVGRFSEERVRDSITDVPCLKEDTFFNKIDIQKAIAKEAVLNVSFLASSY